MIEEAKLIKQGAEAKIYEITWHGKPAIIKEVLSKTYRHPSLDKLIISQRMRNEIKCLVWSSQLGLNVPNIYHMDFDRRIICMEYIFPSILVKEYLNILLSSNDELYEIPKQMLACKIGKDLSLLHSNNMIHGDLTTSNMLIKLTEVDKYQELFTKKAEEIPVVFIDFGLGLKQVLPEDLAVDLFVMESTLLSTHHLGKPFLEMILSSYFNGLPTSLRQIVHRKLEHVRTRRRKKLAIG